MLSSICTLSAVAKCRGNASHYSHEQPCQANLVNKLEWMQLLCTPLRRLRHRLHLEAKDNTSPQRKTNDSSSTQNICIYICLCMTGCQMLDEDCTPGCGFLRTPGCGLLEDSWPPSWQLANLVANWHRRPSGSKHQVFYTKY